MSNSKKSLAPKAKTETQAKRSRKMSETNEGAASAKTDTKPQSNAAAPKAQSIIDSAAAAGRDLVAGAEDSERLGKVFFIKTAIAIKAAGKALEEQCDAEGLQRRRKSGLRYIREVDFLTGFSNISVGDALPQPAKARLAMQLNYVAKGVEVTLWHARNEEIKITGAEGDFDTLLAAITDVGVRNLFSKYDEQRAGRGDLPPQTNAPKSNLDVLQQVRSAYASRKPKAEVAVPFISGDIGDLKLALSTKADDQTLNLHDVLGIPSSAIRSVLSQARDLPTGDVDSKVNLFSDLLLVGQLAAPDHTIDPPKSAGAKKVNGKPDNYRQFLFCPDRGENWISFAHSASHPAVRIIRKDDGTSRDQKVTTPRHYMYTQHRRYVDRFANRFDRHRIAVERVPLEMNVKWCRKLALSVNGTTDVYAIHFHPADGHKIDVKIPDLRDVMWQCTFTLEKEDFTRLFDNYLAAFTSENAEKNDRVVTATVSNKSFGLDFASMGSTTLEINTDGALKKPVKAFVRADDFANVVNAITYLDIDDPVQIRLDPTGLVQMIVPTSACIFEFFIPTTNSRANANRRDAYYRYASRIMEAEAESAAA